MTHKDTAKGASLPSVIETPRLLIKPVAPGLVVMPGMVREKPFESESGDPSYKESYLKNPEMEMSFDSGCAPEGQIILWELIFTLHRIAAGGIQKAEYEAALAYIEKAGAENAAGKAVHMAAIVRKEYEQKESLAALISLSNSDTAEPLLEIMFGTRVHPVTEYLDEAYRAFMRWARGRYGFSRFRLLDRDKGAPGFPPDTVSVYNTKEPDKELYGHINFAPGEDVSIDVYEKPRLPAPEVCEISIDCGGGLSMLVDITLEQDGFSSWSDEPCKFVGNVHGFVEESGDTREEVIAGIRSYFEEHYRC
jgi:hypothetical protein